MSLVSPWNQCRSILTSTSAEEISTLIDSLEQGNSEVFRKISFVAACRNSWKARQISEHDFMHSVKATIDNTVGYHVRLEAKNLVTTLLQNQRKTAG